MAIAKTGGDLKQVLLSLGGSGDGGSQCLGMRDGNCSDSGGDAGGA